MEGQVGWYRGRDVPSLLGAGLFVCGKPPPGAAIAMAVNMAETESKRRTEMRYDPRALDAKWQGRWAEDNLYEVRDDDPRPKWYELTMYPYPSGDLHIGHWYAMSGADAHARFMRMRGVQRATPYGVRRLRAERRERRHRARHPSGQVDHGQHRQDAAAISLNGGNLRLGPRARNVRARVLPVEPVDIPAVPEVRSGLPRLRARQLVPDRQHRAGQRAGRGRPL